MDDAHLSVRDAAALLDVSHQRVHQIVSEVHTQRRAQELRQNMAQVQAAMGSNPIGQLTPGQGLLLAAVLLVGGAALAAANANTSTDMKGGK